MEIPKKLENEIWEYCRVNKITNIDEFVVKLIQQSFTIEKYGNTPSVPKIEKPKSVSSENFNLELPKNTKEHIKFVEDNKERLEKEFKEAFNLTKILEAELKTLKTKKDMYDE